MNFSSKLRLIIQLLAFFSTIRQYCAYTAKEIACGDCFSHGSCQRFKWFIALIAYLVHIERVWKCQKTFPLSFFIYSLITIIIVVDISIRLPPVIMSPSLSRPALPHDSNHWLPDRINHSLHFCYHDRDHFTTYLPWVFLYWCLHPIPWTLRFIHKFLSFPFLPCSPSLCTDESSLSTLWSFANLIASCVYPNDWSPFLHLIGKMWSPLCDCCIHYYPDLNISIHILLIYTHKK